MKATRACWLAFLTLLATILHLTSAQAHFQASVVGKGHRPAKRLYEAVQRRGNHEEISESSQLTRRLSPFLLTAPILPVKQPVTSADNANDGIRSSSAGSSNGNTLANSATGSNGNANNNAASLASNEPIAKDANSAVSSTSTSQGSSGSTQSTQESPFKTNTPNSNNGGETESGTTTANANSLNGQSRTPETASTQPSHQAGTASNQDGYSSDPQLSAADPVVNDVTPVANNVVPSDTVPKTTSSTDQAADNVKDNPSISTVVPEAVDSTTGKTTSSAGKEVQNTGSPVKNSPVLGGDKNSGSNPPTSSTGNKTPNGQPGLVDTVNNTVTGTKLAATPVTASPSNDGSTPAGSQNEQKRPQQSTAPSNSSNVVLDKDAVNGTVVDLGGSKGQPAISVPANDSTGLKNATQVVPIAPVVGTRLPSTVESPLKQPVKSSDTPLVQVTPSPNLPIKNDTVAVPPAVTNPVNNGTVAVPPVVTLPPIKNDTITVPPVIGSPPVKNDTIALPPAPGVGNGPTNTTITPPMETSPTTGQDGQTTPKETAPPAITTPTDEKHNHSAFDYANQQKLLLPEHADNSTSSNTDSATASVNKSSTATATADSKPEKKPEVQMPLVTSIPSVIAPTGVDQVALNTPDIVAVSILFKQSMDWITLAKSPELVAQIFHFMPGIIADCVSIPVENVTTVRLQRQSSTSSHLAKRAESSNSTSDQTLYVANVPVTVGPTLQQKINDPQSSFYTQPSNPVAKELVSQVEPSYNIMQNVSVPTTSSDSSQQGSASSNATLRRALIAVGSVLAACILIFLIQHCRRSAKQKSEYGSDRDTRASSSRRRNYRDTIQTFGSNARNDLRETWAPNGHEQRQVLHGELTEAWDHAEIEQVQDGLLTMGYYEPQMMEPNSGSSLRSARDMADPFSDLAGNKASQETERSNGEIRNTLLSHMQRSTDKSSDSSHSSRMTEAQRILQDYFDSRHNSRELEELQGEYPVIAPNNRTEVYERPAQHTPSHAYGPRSTGSRSPPQRKISISKSSVGQPTMQRNSVLI